VRAPPTLTRVDAVTLLGAISPAQHVDRARDGRRACVADADGAWVLDLPEARVVTAVAVPEGVLSQRVLDDERLLVHDGAGALRVFALPDGGEVARVRAPTGRAAHAHAAHALAMPGGGELALRGGEIEVALAGPLYVLVDLRTGACRDVSAQRVADALMHHPGQRLAFAHRPDGDLDPWPEFSPDGERLALALTLPPRLDHADEFLDWTHALTLDVDDPDATMHVWPCALEGYTMCWRGADELGGYVPVRTGPRPYDLCPFAIRRGSRDAPACTWHPTAPFTVRDGVVALGFTLDDGAMLAAFSGPGRAVTLARDLAGVVVTRDHLAAVPPAALDETRPVLIHAWSDGGVALALPRPNGDTGLVVRGREVATIPAVYGSPQAMHVPDRGVDLVSFTESPHRIVRGVWLPP
jgi:hypothetical protein